MLRTPAAQNASMLQQLYFSQTLRSALMTQSLSSYSPAQSKLSLRNINPNSFQDQRQQIEKIINFNHKPDEQIDDVKPNFSFSNDKKAVVKQVAYSDTGVLTPTGCKTGMFFFSPQPVSNKKQLMNTAASAVQSSQTLHKDQMGPTKASLDDADDQRVNLPDINSSANWNMMKATNSESPIGSQNEAFGQQLDKYESQYKIIDIIRNIDKKEADRLIVKPRVQLEKSRPCVKGSFRNTIFNGQPNHHRSKTQQQGELPSKDLNLKNLPAAQPVVGTPSDQYQGLESGDSGSLPGHAEEFKGKKVLGERQYKRYFGQQMDKIAYQIRREAEQKAAGETAAHEAENAPALTKSKPQTKHIFKKRVHKLDPQIRVELDRYLDGGSVVAAQATLDKPYEKYFNFQFFPNSMKIGKPRRVAHSQMSFTTEGAPSEKSEDWLAINFGGGVDEEVAAMSLAELQKQESRTYERMFTPPEQDKTQEEIKQMMSQMKKHTEATVLKMMKLKKAQMDKRDNEVQDDFQFTKESGHLRPKDIERIEGGYNSILEQIEFKLKSALEVENLKNNKGGDIVKADCTKAAKSAIAEKTIKKFVDGIRRRQEFYGVVKHASDALISQKGVDDPKIRFFNICKEEHAIAIPVLARIEKKVLNLIGYKMNLGLCHAVGQAFRLANDVVEKLLFESTGMDDPMFAAILEGLSDQSNFKSVTYNSNSFENLEEPLSHLTVSALIKLAKRPVPYNLDEIRIINCKISPAAVQFFLEEIQGANIRRLSLVKTQIDKVLIDPLLQLLQTSYSLIKLDISWNKLTPDDLKKLFVVLSTNRQMRNLNLSWNNIQDEAKYSQEEIQKRVEAKELLLNQMEDAKDVLAIAKEEQRQQHERKVAEKKEKMLKRQARQQKAGGVADKASNDMFAALEDGAPDYGVKLKELDEEKALKELQDKYAAMIATEKALDQDEQEILLNLGKFIKYNKKLLQLDLSHTGLQENLLRELVTCLRRAKSLLIFDVSGNLNRQRRPQQLLTMKVRDQRLNAHTGEPQSKSQNRDKLLDYLSTRIRCKPNPFDLYRLNNISTFFNDLNRANKENYTKAEKILDSMETRNIREATSTKFTNKLTTVKTYQNNETLIYQRILGHKNDMPGSGQWAETSADTTPAELMDDWITEKSIYTLVFWSKNFAKEVQIGGELNQQEVQNIAKLLQKPDHTKIKEICQNLKNKAPPLPYFLHSEIVETEREYLSPPLLAGSMNNWQYSPMYKIQDLISMLNRDHEDIIGDMIEKGKMPDNIKKPSQMRRSHLEHYLYKRLKQDCDYLSDWQNLLTNKCLRYQNPSFINLNHFEGFPKERREYQPEYMVQLLMQETGNDTDRRYAHSKDYEYFMRMLDEELLADDQLWVGVAMARPGRHQYIVRYQDHKAKAADEAARAAAEAGEAKGNAVDAHANTNVDRTMTGSMSQQQHSSYSLDSPTKFMLQKLQSQGEQEAEDPYTKYSFHRCVVQVREEEVPPFAQISKTHVNVRIFNKQEPPSVFIEWREDTKKQLNEAFRADKENWKLHKFIKDVEDLQLCQNVLIENFVKIREIFQMLISKSQQWYPCIGWINYSDFCVDCKIDLPLATIDRTFIATNVQMEIQDDNPSQALNRYEFLEIIARLAKEVYKDRGICSTVHESIQKFLDEHIFKYGFFDAWQEFRDKSLWTLEVNDVFLANLDLLKSIFKLYFNTSRSYMSKQDALDFMCRHTTLQMAEKDAIYCFGMSKMTVINEHEHHKQFNSLRFVEFLELIGRIAELKFKTSGMNEIPLYQRIEYVLDDIIPVMLPGKERRVPCNEEVEHSDSDDDY